MMKRILLVEYATSTIEIIKELFAHPMFNLTIVNEGDVAKEKLSETHFDLLITAAMLPKFHGFNLSQYTAQHYPKTRIIIISEIYKGMDYKLQATTQYKANDFFEKPFDKAKFKNRALELLEIFEHDLEEVPPTPTTQMIIQDTNKIPTLQKLLENNSQMSSEDLFGDIIDAVQEGQSTYEIKLNDDHEPSQQFPHPPATTQPIPQPVSKTEKPKPAPSPQKKTPAQDLLTQKLSVQQLQNEITSHETKPEVIFTPAPNVQQTMPLPIVTQVLKQPPSPSPVTQKIDLHLLDFIKQENQDKDKAKASQKNKRIEDDISRKFEETLSGLGLGATTKPTKPTPPITPITPITPTSPITPTPENNNKKTELLPSIPIPPPSTEKKNNTDEIGGYEILSLIARGGMAEIYKAKKTGVKGFEKLVALKKILSGYGADAKYIEMFVDEAKIAAQLSHPNIVQIYDLGKKDDYYFIAMEYVSGKDLRHILHRLEDANTTIPEELAIYLTIKILEALSYAHTARDGEGRKLEIVHRDVSPPNILVSYNGNVKLTDFGVSKASIKLHHTVAGALKGKLLYMSPEQAKGDADIDYRSDIYSAGIILFELITGQKLFMGASEISTLQKVQDGKIIRPRQFKKDITPHLEAIILKALEKDINLRFQKASDMIKALDAYMLKNYDNTPDTSHLTHFMYTLFKDQIIQEKLEINLKPLPYAIKRKPREAPVPHPESPRIEIQPSTAAPSPAPSFTPPPKTAPTPPPPSIPPTTPTAPTPPTPPATPKPATPPTRELTPKPLFKPAPPPHVEPESEIFQLSLDQQIEAALKPPLTPPAQKPVPNLSPSKPAAEEEFHPLIEINFDDDVTVPPIHQNKTTPTSPNTLPPDTSKPPLPTSPPALFAHYNAHPHKDSPKNKKILLIVFIIAIIILVIAIIYFLTSATSSSSKPVPIDPNNVVSHVQSSPSPTLPLSTTSTPSSLTTPPGTTTQPASTQTPVVDNTKKDTQLPPATLATNLATTPVTKKDSDTQVTQEPSQKNNNKENQKAPDPIPTPDNSQPSPPILTPQATGETQPATDTPETKPEVKQQAESSSVKEGDTLAISLVDTQPIPISNPIDISLSIKRMLMSDQRVLVSFLIDQNGRVETVKLIQQSSIKKLNSSIIETVQTWTFQPATKNNVKVKVWKNKWIVITK